MSGADMVVIDADNSVVVESEHWALRGLADKINVAVDAAEACAKSAVQHALAAGALLARAKSHTQHGQWETWLKANCRVAPRTARAYMRLAERWPELQNGNGVAAMPLRDAIRAISTSPTTPKRASGFSPYMRTNRDDRQRFVDGMRKVASEIRRVAKFVDMNFTKPKDIERARNKLQAAMDLLDKFQAAGEVQQ